MGTGGLLKDAGLGLREVMCMDGGAEAQMDILVEGFSYRQYGSPSTAPRAAHSFTSRHHPGRGGAYSPAKRSLPPAVSAGE